MPSLSRKSPGAPPLAGELGLVAAILRQAVVDARGESWGRGGAVCEEARAFLRDGAQVAFWVELLGMEAQPVLKALRQAAGVEPHHG